MKLNYFNFKEFHGKILLTNDMGKYAFIEKQDFRNLLSEKMDMQSDVGKKLIETGMIFEGPLLQFSEKNKWRMAEVKSHLSSATALHIFVYCQANNGTTTPMCFMNEAIADRAVDIALQSPNQNLSFEFQGGEPLFKL